MKKVIGAVAIVLVSIVMTGCEISGCGVVLGQDTCETLNLDNL